MLKSKRKKLVTCSVGTGVGQLRHGAWAGRHLVNGEAAERSSGAPSLSIGGCGWVREHPWSVRGFGGTGVVEQRRVMFLLGGS